MTIKDCHEGRITQILIANLGKMHYLITGGEDNKLKFWELSPSRKTFEERTFLDVEGKFSVAMIHENRIYIGT